MSLIIDDPTPDRPRFLSEADAHDLARRLARYAKGGGFSGVYFRSQWKGATRWARNRLSSIEDDEDHRVLVLRDINGAHHPRLFINETTELALVAALRQTERLLQFAREVPHADLITQVQLEPMPTPELFFERTYQLDAAQRAETARSLIQSAEAAGMLSAGYLEVRAQSEALLTSFGIAMYHRYTWAQYSVTVRDPAGIGSGWAGVDWPDWSRIDAPALSATALDKCLASRNPVRVEPGRYTTILEPQAVCDLIEYLWFDAKNYWEGGLPFNKVAEAEGVHGSAKIGERVVDERITISADPMDPDLGFPPFGQYFTTGDPWTLLQTHISHPVTWIKNGVLMHLENTRKEAIFNFGENLGRPNPRAYRISVSGPSTPVAEMIATTKRGLLVTRFDNVDVLHYNSILCRGYTRDGLWLIENGKISKPVINMAFTESPLFAFNNIEQLGTPQRAFHPPASGWYDTPRPIIAPPMKVRDFSFTALSDAI